MTDVTDHATSVSNPSAAGPSFMQIPLAITRNRNLSRSAHELYGRLVLFAGKDGRCNPSHETLATSLGVQSRQIRNLLKSLAECGLVEWRRTRSSASYTIHPPEAFRIPDRQCIAGLERQSIACEIGNALPIKRGLNRGSLKDVRDLDCLPTHRTTRDTPRDVQPLPPSTPKPYPRLTRVIARYMANSDSPSNEYFPSPEKVVEVIGASFGASEDEVIECLRYHYEERGNRPGTRNGPKSFNWFPTVVHEYFGKRRDREESTAPPCGMHEWEGRNVAKMDNEEISRMSAAFEAPEEAVAVAWD